jgi:hypothetical protein
MLTFPKAVEDVSESDVNVHTGDQILVFDGGDEGQADRQAARGADEDALNCPAASGERVLWERPKCRDFFGLGR